MRLRFFAVTGGIFLFFLLFGLAFVGVLRAHSFYPLECCSDRDCFPIRVDDVSEVRGGWALKDGTFIPFQKARPSPDGQFHLCRHQDGKGALIQLEGLPACFWAPIGAS